MSGSSCEDGGGRERLLGSEESSSDVWATRPTNARDAFTSSSSLQSRSRSYNLPTLSEEQNPRSAYSGSRIPQDGTQSSFSAAQKYSRGGMATAWMTKENQDEKDDIDDALHDWRDAHEHGSIYSNGFPVRAVMNVGFLVLLAGAILMLFGGYPVISELTRAKRSANGSNLGGVNGTGQIADLPGLISGLIDPDTPESVKTRTGFDGKKYELVFSDEFNVDGRTFYPGDDPFWEAVDLHYWQTGNYEWYSRDAVVTQDGNMRLTLTEMEINKLNFRGGMVSTWNKFCFSGGYLEASIRLPGHNDVSGLWPAFWMMGNLARAGYGASIDGTWPYSYEACDSGTLMNQTDSRGQPEAVQTAGRVAFNRPYNTEALSWKPGQKLSACTCPSDDHPGPKMSDGSWKGRASPEIDVFEAQAGAGKNGGPKRMQVSQSLQAAPFNSEYTVKNTTGPAFAFHQESAQLNSYKGAILQQALSTIVDITPQTATQQDGGDFAVYGTEFVPGTGDDARITWVSGGEKSWSIYAPAMDPEPEIDMSRRPIATEPMYIILNLGVSASFGNVEWDKLDFPNVMDVDYVRVYQPSDNIDVGCDPDHHPTADYINRHPEAYQNPQLTDWGLSADKGGYGGVWPRNRLDGGCDAEPTNKPGNPDRPHPKAPFIATDDLPGY